ncbi:hypothetical protein ACS0TY_022930 [Phlomoides rotata]
MTSCYLYVLLSLISFVQSFNNGGVTIDLIHCDSPLSPSHDPSKTQFQRLRDAIDHSFSRKSSLLKQTPQALLTGIDAADTLTLGSTVSFPNFVFGCGRTNGGTFNPAASGIFGLGNGHDSIVNQQLRIEATLKKAIKGTPVKDPEGTFTLCYKSPITAVVPPITAHFKGADLVLPHRSIFVEFNKLLFCLSFVQSPDTSIFGKLH